MGRPRGIKQYIVENLTLQKRFMYLTSEDVKAFKKTTWKGHKLNLIEIDHFKSVK